MTDELKTVKVAITLANDVLTAISADVLAAISDLENVISKLNEQNSYAVKFDLVWCNEQSVTEESIDWSQYFYYETPVPLIEKINQIHKPDLIIGAFWKLFGAHQKFSDVTPDDAKRKSEEIAREWNKKDFPKTKILFCKQDPKLSEADKEKRLFMSHFRSQVDEDIWTACNKSQIVQKIEEVLSGFIKSNFGDWAEDERVQKYEKSPLLNLNLPSGWLYLNKRINEKSELIGRELSKADAENFFNGKRPSLEEVISSTVPHRTKNKEIKEIINKAAAENRFAVVLLLGAGGEGKSTILMQVACDLVIRRTTEIHIILRQEATNLLELIESLKDKKENFLIVSDDAQQIAKELSKLSSRFDKPDNIQFLLTSRTTHWEWEGSANSILTTYLGRDRNFIRQEIGTLNEQDAEKIVKAWRKADVLGKLNGEKEPAKRLLEAARLTADKTGKQNSFFSSILWVRKHETLDERVKDILAGLKEKSSLNGKALDYYYNYIIALHADGLTILTDSVLQKALGCDKATLKEQITDPLVGETAIIKEGALILARHNVFAERAKEIQIDSVDFDAIIGELAVAAVKLYYSREINETEVNKWHDLKNYYFKRRKPSQPETAEIIVKAVATDKQFDSDPIKIANWANFLLKWGRQLEENGKFDEAKEKFLKADYVFLSNYDRIKPHKSYLTDWGVLQGLLERTFFNVWLAAAALTDDIKDEKSYVRPMAMRLVTLAAAFSKSFTKAVHNKTQADIFKRATEGAVKLGTEKNAEEKNLDFPNIRDYGSFRLDKKPFDLSLKEVGSSDISILSAEDAFLSVLRGINLAWKLCEIDAKNLPSTLPNAPDLKFNKLKKELDITISPEQEKEIFLEEIQLNNFDKSSNTEMETNVSAVPESKKDSGYIIFRRSEETIWEIVFNGAEPFYLAETDGIPYIHKLLKKRNSGSNPNVFISAKQLFDEDGKDTNKKQTELNKNLRSNIEAVLNNISKEYYECYEFFKKIIKVRLIGGHAYLQYEPTNPEPKWQLE